MKGYLRQANKDDMDLLFEWANEESVRRNSFSMRTISYEEHQRWFTQILAKTDCKQYIYILEGEAIGQVRLQTDGDTAEISYSICSAKRCRGYEKIMLQLLYKQAKEDFPKVKFLIAKVKPDNIASKKVFMDLGYTEQDGVFQIKLDMKEATLNDIKIAGSGVLFLTNNVITISLFDWLRGQCEVYLYSEYLHIDQLKEWKPSLIVSYNYKYLIEKDIIDYMKENIINLHISYLPWNRGSDPNIWSFIDDTPKGVTIHQISTRLDAGKILYQKECHFETEQETFETSYWKLNQLIIELFKEKWEDIWTKKYILFEQKGIGSYHKRRDLERIKEKVPFEWNDNISDFLVRYNAFYKK